MEERRNESNIGCFGKTEGNMLQKETGLKCKNNIKGDFEEIDWENLDWIHLCKVRDIWLLLMGNNFKKY